MGDFLEFAITVLLLALVAVATLVRKAIEKASAGEKGKKIDLGKAVQTQLSKYMKAFQGTAALPGQPPARTPAPEAPAEPPARVEERRAPLISMPPPMPVEKPRRRRPKAHDTRRLAARGRPLAERTKAEFVARAELFRVSRNDVRRAIILAELLGPPMAARENYRLF
ncbi:MAG: hypothetical protein ACYS99_10950 [Planctomycetota bacterium]|jgi:hypothetical protein